MNRILITLGLSGLLIFIFGFGTGYLYLNSQLNALETIVNTMEDEIFTTHSRLQKQDNLVEDLREGFGKEKFDHSETQMELTIANNIINSLNDQSSLLLEVQESLLLNQEALSLSQANVNQLNSELEDLTEIDTGLKAVAALHGDVLRMKIEIEPLLGEGDLLATRGIDAFNQGNHGNSAIYFDEASQTYLTATNRLTEIAKGNTGLVEAVAPIAGIPTISHIPAIFAKSQNNAFSDVQLSTAKSLEYKAASTLAEVLAEWNLLIRPPSDTPYENWGDKIRTADSDVAAALEALEVALELTPDRWQEIKVRELETLELRTLSNQIKVVVLGE